MKVRFLRPGYFIWLVVPVAACLAYPAFGLPHVIWSYDWRGTSHDPAASRHYTRCTFIGPYGAITTHPANGKCGWLLFRKKGEKG